MPKFTVDLVIEMTKQVTIEAASADEARALADDMAQVADFDEAEAFFHGWVNRYTGSLIPLDSE